MDIRGYAKYVLKNGKVEEKREILGCLWDMFCHSLPLIV